MPTQNNMHLHKTQVLICLYNDYYKSYKSYNSTQYFSLAFNPVSKELVQCLK